MYPDTLTRDNGKSYEVIMAAVSMLHRAVGWIHSDLARNRGVDYANEHGFIADLRDAANDLYGLSRYVDLPPANPTPLSVLAESVPVPVMAGGGPDDNYQPTERDWRDHDFAIRLDDLPDFVPTDEDMEDMHNSGQPTADSSGYISPW